MVDEFDFSEIEKFIRDFFKSINGSVGKDSYVKGKIDLEIPMSIAEGKVKVRKNALIKARLVGVEVKEKININVGFSRHRR